MWDPGFRRPPMYSSGGTYPGKLTQGRHFRYLGICRTRTIAERRAAEKLNQLGINSTQSFIEATSTISFANKVKNGSNLFPNGSAIPLEQTTIDNRRYAMDKWIYPHIGIASWPMLITGP